MVGSPETMPTQKEKPCREKSIRVSMLFVIKQKFLNPLKTHGQGMRPQPLPF